MTAYGEVAPQSKPVCPLFLGPHPASCNKAHEVHLLGVESEASLCPRLIEGIQIYNVAQLDENNVRDNVTISFLTSKRLGKICMESNVQLVTLCSFYLCRLYNCSETSRAT